MHCSNITNSFNNNELRTPGYSGCSSCTFSSEPRCANAYVPVQTFSTIYSPSEGLANGTMFPELFSPYSPTQSFQEFNYLRNFNDRRCDNERRCCNRMCNDRRCGERRCCR